MHAIQNLITYPQSTELGFNGTSGYTIANNRLILNTGEIFNNRPSGNLSGTLSLELWALNETYRGFDFCGIPLAGIAIGELRGQHVIHPSTWDLAFQEPPAGSWQLTLMLREWNGSTFETRDFVNFALPYRADSRPGQAVSGNQAVTHVSFVEQTKSANFDAQTGHWISNESFIQSHGTRPVPGDLLLQGNCGYDLQNNRISMNVGEIVSRRQPGNISGTLSLELWALPQPYQGGYFDGFALAGASIGQVHGQQSAQNLNVQADFQEAPEGTWYLSLMLREWDGSAYITQDAINFAAPYVVKPKSIAVRGDQDNVITVNFGDGKRSPAQVSEPSPAENASTVTGASINQVTLDELASLKGVPRKTAESIIAARPFSTFEDVSKVKGVGPKFLKLLRELFSL